MNIEIGRRNKRRWSGARLTALPDLGNYKLPGAVSMLGGAILAVLLLWSRCTLSTVGGGPTSTEVVGCIMTPDSIAVERLRVTMSEYVEETQSFVDAIPVFTDQKGNFAFKELTAGRYLLEAMGAGGLSVMEEVVVVEGQGTPLGILIADTVGSLQGLIRKTPDATVDAEVYVQIYKGTIPIDTLLAIDAYSKDSLPPGDFRVLKFGKIICHDEYFLAKKTITPFEKVITIYPRTVSVDTVDVNDEAIRTADSVTAAEIRMVKDFLVKAGCEPFVSAGWLHLNTGRIRIIEATATNGMSLDSAAHALAAFPGIEKIRLSGFSGTEIPDTLFTFGGLTELSLTNGAITGIPGRIALLSRLRSLRLDRNAITQLPGVALDRTLPLLQYADFTGNPLRRIEWEQQEAVNSLLADGIQIILSGKPCAINERDYRALLSFFKQNGLDDRIVHTYITTGIEINEPDVVTGIAMNDVTITGFPSDFGHLTGLRHLYIAKNAIDTLSQVIGDLSMLQTLYITNGTIRGLPMQLGRCIHLQTIDFSNNRITRLPKWLGTLRSLKDGYADFSNNNIDTTNTTVPDFCVIEHQNSEPVAPASDSLFTVDTAIVGTIVNYGNGTGTLPLMNYVQCRGNRVVLLRLVIDSEVRFAAFDTLCATAALLDSLKTLHIVMRFGADAFPEVSTVFPYLEELIVTGGVLGDLSPSFATSFPAIERIALPGNRFDEIPPVLRSLPVLVAVDLYYNRLTNLTNEDSLWLDGVSVVNRRALWDTGFGFSYEPGMTWRESQLGQNAAKSAQ